MVGTVQRKVGMVETVETEEQRNKKNTGTVVLTDKIMFKNSLHVFSIQKIARLLCFC